jgi:hypothetical protein
MELAWCGQAILVLGKLLDAAGSCAIECITIKKLHEQGSSSYRFHAFWLLR